MITVRPRVTDLVFQLYGRALHPELFEIHQTRVIERPQYGVKIDITSTGHVVTWRYAGLTLTEVATGAHCPLPERRRLLCYRLNGRRQDRVECRGKASYQTSFQLDLVEPEAFWALQQEILWDSISQGMLQRFDSGGRIALGAMSYVTIEPRRHALAVRAIHTFPNDFAVVRTQSLFQLP